MGLSDFNPAMISYIAGPLRTPISTISWPRFLKIEEGEQLFSSKSESPSNSARKPTKRSGSFSTTATRMGDVMPDFIDGSGNLSPHRVVQNGWKLLILKCYICKRNLDS